MDRQVVGPVEVVGGVGVLVEQVDGDVVVGGAVSVGVRLDAARGVGVGAAIAPVDDPAGDGVAARVGDRAQGQAVRAALIDAGRTADGDRRRDVVDVDRQVVGPVEVVGGVGVLVEQVDGDVVVGGAVGVGVRLDAARGVGVGAAIAPVDDLAGDGVAARVGDRAQGQAVRAPSLTLAAPLMAIVGATLLTVIVKVAWPEAPFLSVTVTVTVLVAGPSAYV